MRIRFENQERCMQNVENKKAYPINPPIPEGYFRDVTIEEFFVIQRMSDGSRFVWISVKSVESDGTFIKRKVGSKKFISMAFLKNVNLNEAFKKEFALQCESVKKYGGFYISCFYVSKNPDGKPVITKEGEPWNEISYDSAKEIAKMFENTDKVKSHLLFGSEYDASVDYDFECNKMMMEWTQESKGIGVACKIVRNSKFISQKFPKNIAIDNEKSKDITFRIALWIE